MLNTSYDQIKFPGTSDQVHVIHGYLHTSHSLSAYCRWAVGAVGIFVMRETNEVTGLHGYPR